MNKCNQIFCHNNDVYNELYVTDSENNTDRLSVYYVLRELID